MLAILFLLPFGAADVQPSAAPSRPSSKGCAWEVLSDSHVGLLAWVERCDYGFRKIDFLFRGASLVMRFSDGGEPEPVIDVLDLGPGETPTAGITRLFSERTPPATARRCMIVSDRGKGIPPGVQRFRFVPDAAYQRELDKKADPESVPDPPCGDWGEAPDGIQYFEAQPQSGSRHVLFVRVGQDEPLFDDNTLRLLPEGAVGAGGGQGSGALSETDRKQLRSEELTPLAHVRDIPPHVQMALAGLFGNKTLEMAEPGAAWQVTDVVMDPNLPVRRLVRAACSQDHCLVHYERGGIVHTFHVLLFSISAARATLQWGGAARGATEDVGALKELVLEGKAATTSHW
jgi:hypothetical protein